MKPFRQLCLVTFAGCMFATVGCSDSNEVTVNQPKEVKTQEQILQEIAEIDAENERLARERQFDD
ncbi:hypothetical protein [Novipirellula rosea]|uniref:Secreted protein n=1 Tax=Novipirellula rosea TaxID=1031540 RepID=A0ABP8M3E4_9BACT